MLQTAGLLRRTSPHTKRNRTVRLPTFSPYRRQQIRGIDATEAQAAKVIFLYTGTLTSTSMCAGFLFVADNLPYCQYCKNFSHATVELSNTNERRKM